MNKIIENGPVREYYENDALIKRTVVDEEEDRTEIYKNGSLNSLDGKPSVIVKDPLGFRFEYHKDGKLHNENGPAIECAGRSHLNMWYLDGMELSKMEILKLKMTSLRDKFLPNSGAPKKNTSLKM